MANQAYNYSSSYGGGGSGLSSFLSSRLTSAGSDPYLSAPSSLIGSSRYLNAEPGNFSAFSSGRIGANRVFSPIWNIGVDPAMVSDLKRTSEARYHQNLLGTHSTYGQSESLFSANSLAKRPKLETASNLPIYPQRPGEKTCTHYMLTRICKFGDTCKFDHPLWVPEGGIPDWKEVVLTNTSESLPERPGEPDCPYYMKTEKCKFGLQCKFNHPKSTSAGGIAGHTAEYVIPVLPERPSQPICSFYARTGTCKFGANCMYHHPKDIQLPSTGQNPSSTGQMTTVKGNEAVAGGPNPENLFVPFIPALLHNSMGLPIRPGETECPFYLKTGSCKFGANCRFSHPERSSNNLPVPGALGHLTVPPAATLPIEAFNLANILPNIERLAQAALGLAPTSIYPQRPGETECDFYMKTGQCKFGERCRYHHPIRGSAPTPPVATQPQQNVKLTLAGLPRREPQQNVKLTLAGLPRREGAGACQYYMKTGACKFGATCRFDHPPPGEAVAMATNPAQLYGASKED